MKYREKRKTNASWNNRHDRDDDSKLDKRKRLRSSNEKNPMLRDDYRKKLLRELLGQKLYKCNLETNIAMINDLSLQDSE